jgi:hypothetical protein
LEMLRDRPEISPCSSSGKLDWTTFTEGVSIAPTPRPMSARRDDERRAQENEPLDVPRDEREVARDADGVH